MAFIRARHQPRQCAEHDNQNHQSPRIYYIIRICNVELELASHGGAAFLSMSLTTDRASASPSPSRWRMRNITLAAIVLGACKLAFSTSVLAVGKFKLGLDAGSLRTLAFVTLVFGNQAVLYALRERRRIWSSKPGSWIFASSALDVAVVAGFAAIGILMTPLPAPLIVGLLGAAAAFALILDQIKVIVATVIDVD